MVLDLVLGLLVLLGIFLVYVSRRDGKFRYERSGVIQASSEVIFPYLTSFQKGGEWHPYQKMDPAMKVVYTGVDGHVGSRMDFESKKTGTGSVEILNIVPNEVVELRLTMLKPFKAVNKAEYRLIPEAGGTRFSWSMSGEGGFISKLMTVLIDCEKLVAGEFANGVQSLKTLIESKGN